MANKQKTEERDELGFTPSDYCDMQKLADYNGKLNDTLLDGWDITPEQIRLINSPRHPFHSVAVTAFYDVNFKRLRRMACAFIRHSPYLLNVIDESDLTQQFYVDLLSGFVKLQHDTENIRTVIYRCFKYAAVGGLEDVEDVKEFRAA